MKWFKKKETPDKNSNLLKEKIKINIRNSYVLCIRDLRIYLLTCFSVKENYTIEEVAEIINDAFKKIK